MATFDQVTVQTNTSDTVAFQTDPGYETLTSVVVGVNVMGIQVGVIGNGKIGVYGKSDVEGPGVLGESLSTGVVGNGLGEGNGVTGQGGPDGAVGVLGRGTKSLAGVAGYGDAKGNATGVYGQGGGEGGVGVYGLGGFENSGVYGQAGGVFGNGVEGHGTGTLSGVAGFGDADGDSNNVNGTGVFGQGSGPGGPGLRGIGSGGPDTWPPTTSGVGGQGEPENSGAAGVYGQGGPQNPGVVGQAGTGTADGVRGVGTGAGSGVAGYGDPASSGSGVFGQGQGLGAVGVRGVGSGSGPVYFPSSPVGVYGQGGADGAAGVWGAGGTGVLAQGSNVGVVAEGGDTGLNATGATVGVRGEGHTGVVAAANGQPASIGLFASGNAANEMAGEFLGDVVILGDLLVSQLKSAVVPLPDGTHRRLYCVESPESWFEDVGFGTLVNGQAEISLDPGFASTVQTDQYHVFITEYDGSNGLYVTARSATGFEVRAGAGAVDASFSYRVMAKRKDIQGARLQEVELPAPPQT